VLPRRHILDVLEFTTERSEILSMAAMTLAVDAIKYLRPDSKVDHLVEVLDLNEFICNMYPSFRPRNRSLLFHVISDLLGLLLFGIPKKRRRSIESLEIIDYSSKRVSDPVATVWRYLKSRMKGAKLADEAIVDGFVNKIRIEIDILRRYPSVEEVFAASRDSLAPWIPSLAGFYGASGDEIVKTYDDWSKVWLTSGDIDRVVDGMMDRLSSQSLRDFGVSVDAGHVKSLILQDPENNRRQNETFTGWYRQGVEMLFRI
jgi:hypothetical protein